jgi:hypothetical protein
LDAVLRNRNRNRRNRIILTQEEPEPYPCSRFRFRLRFLLQKKISNYIYSDGTLANTCMKLAREETKIKVTGRSFYRKKNLKFKGRNRNRSRKRNRSRNRGQKNWDPEPEPRQNGTVPQHCLDVCWKKN